MPIIICERSRAGRRLRRAARTPRLFRRRIQTPRPRGQEHTARPADRRTVVGVLARWRIIQCVALFPHAALVRCSIPTPCPPPVKPTTCTLVAHSAGRDSLRYGPGNSQYKIQSLTGREAFSHHKNLQYLCLYSKFPSHSQFVDVRAQSESHFVKVNYIQIGVCVPCDSLPWQRTVESRKDIARLGVSGRRKGCSSWCRCRFWQT